jgi:hypothetical protein
MKKIAILKIGAGQITENRIRFKNITDQQKIDKKEDKKEIIIQAVKLKKKDHKKIRKLKVIIKIKKLIRNYKNRGKGLEIKNRQDSIRNKIKVFDIKEETLMTKMWV